MINVDVYVPALDEVFDFELDANAQISQILTEMIQILSEHIKEDINSDMKEFLLCIPQQERVLPMHLTVQACGVKNGDRLILV